MTGLTRISDVLNLAGVKNNTRPFNEGDISFECPDCGLGQTSGKRWLQNRTIPEGSQNMRVVHAMHSLPASFIGACNPIAVVTGWVRMRS